MGRNRTGVMSVSESRRLNIRFLLKNKYLVKDAHITGVISWTDDVEISFETFYTNDTKYIRLGYSKTDKNGVKRDYDIKINIVSISSNLGKGEIIYLQCPESGKNAKTLFMAYGHYQFIHKDCYLQKYGLRLYYDSQIASKLYYNTTRYFSLEKQVEGLQKELQKKYKKLYYKGVQTKAFQNFIKLKENQDFHDYKRNRNLKLLLEKFSKK